MGTIKPKSRKFLHFLFLLYEELFYFMKTISQNLLKYQNLLKFIKISKFYNLFQVSTSTFNPISSYLFLTNWSIFIITKNELLWHSKTRNNNKCQVRNSCFFDHHLLPINTLKAIHSVFIFENQVKVSKYPFVAMATYSN